MSITQSLRRAAKLQEKIEELRSQLATVLDQARSELASTPAEEITLSSRRGQPKTKKLAAGRHAGVAKAPVPRGRKSAPKSRRRSPLKGVKRAASPSGPLAPAVVKVLHSRKQPMNVRDILDGLLANGYHFNAAEPKKNLAARIYRLSGVKQVSAGLFAAV